MSKMGKSLSLMAAVLLVTAVSLTACAPPKPAQQFTLRIGVLSIQDTMPYFVIQELGIDKKYGLQFEEKTYQGGSAIIDAIADGSLDVSFTVGTVPVLLASERGLIPDKILFVAANTFADPDHPAVGVLVAPTVTSWQDLKGQQIAVPSVSSITSAAIKGRLLAEGVSGYSLIEIPFPNMGLAVAGGNVAAAAMNEPYLTQSLLRNDGKLLGWVVGGPPFERLQATMIVFRTNLYHSNPETVKAFLRAYLQAVKWIDQNPEKARLIMAKRLSLAPEVASKIYMARFSLDGHNDPALLESMQIVLVDVGMLKAPIPVNQLYDETLLNEVLAEKR